jgi:SAM-dependent methyltransferase
MLDALLSRASPSYQLRRKRESELTYWKSELVQLRKWFDGSVSHWGVPPPRPEQKLYVSELWVVNAVLTRHAVRPSYLETLQLESNAFQGKTVLEVGSGPLAPILQFADCKRHCVDPLVNTYMFAGWPLFAYDAKFLHGGAESLPYPDAYFDAVVSVNALDHVDDFERTCSEIERVLRPGGQIRIEIEYHEPTVTEPLTLDDARVRKAFSRCELQPIIRRSGRERAEALTARFGLVPFAAHFDGKFCTWWGERGKT